MTQLLPLVITSPLHNKHDSVNIGNFFINISQFEDSLEFK